MEDASLNIIIDLSKLIIDRMNEPSVSLTPVEISWINQFITASPTSFTIITNDIQTLTSTGHIGLHSIPKLIKIIADVYNSGPLNSKPEDIIMFVKFTLYVILNSPLVNLPPMEKAVIEVVVNTSLELLSMNINNIKTEVDIIQSSKCCSAWYH
jgi:hypothetical protein